MKIKKIKYIVIIFLIFICFTFNSNASSNIVSINSQKVNYNTGFYLVLNLSNITFTKFKVEIENTSALKPSNMTSGVSELSNNTGLTSFIVDKSSIGLDKIGIIYTSGNEDSIINFKVTITNLDTNISELEEQIKELNNEISILNTNLENLKNTLSGIDETSEEYEKIESEINNLQININSKNEEIENITNQISNGVQDEISETISVEVTNLITEDSDIDKKSDKFAWEDMDSMMKDKMNMEDEKMSASMKEMMSKMSSLELDLESANNKISSLTTTNTYHGSQNNYLKSLSITGEELKNEFKKTTSDYFVTVDKQVENVTVNAVAEDSSSIVTIYGNTNLQEGKNKVIVSVTSEDGSVRNYKIYITK